MFQRKIVIHIHIQEMWVATLRQESYRWDPDHAYNFGSGNRTQPAWCNPDTPLCLRFPASCSRQLPLPLWDTHLPDLKHQTLFFSRNGARWRGLVSMQVARHLRVRHFGTKPMLFNRAESCLGKHLPG